MSKPAIDLNKLTVEEKLTLLEDVWDDLTAGGGAPTLSTDVRDEVHRRLRDHDPNTTDGKPWREAVDALRAK